MWGGGPNFGVKFLQGNYYGKIFRDLHLKNHSMRKKIQASSVSKKNKFKQLVIPCVIGLSQTLKAILYIAKNKKKTTKNFKNILKTIK